MHRLVIVAVQLVSHCACCVAMAAGPRERGSSGVDTVLASSDESQQYDLFYHVRGSLRECTKSMQPRLSLDQGNGYGHVSSLAGSTCRGEAKLVFDLRDVAGTLVLQCNSDHPYELTVGTCPDIPADRKMSVIMLRRTAKAALWRNQITIDDSSTTEQ